MNPFAHLHSLPLRMLTHLINATVQDVDGAIVDGAFVAVIPIVLQDYVAAP